MTSRYEGNYNDADPESKEDRNMTPVVVPKAPEKQDTGYNGKISRADWKKKREEERERKKNEKAKDEQGRKEAADASAKENAEKKADEQKKKEEADAKAKEEEEKRISIASKKGENKASADYAEKKKKCAFKKSQIAMEEKNGMGSIKSKKKLEKFQKEFKNLACGKYFDEHADLHEEAHKKLAADSSAALADHKNRVHKAISGMEDITSGSILEVLSETIGKRSNVAMKRVLLKSDELIDVVVATLEEKIKTSGIPAIMGIEIVTGIISFIIDIIPIPEIGILATAIQGVGDAAIDMISAVGPDSIIKTIEDKFLPIIEKMAVIFQGLAGSLSCCDKDKRVDKINISSSIKNELIKSFKELKKSIEKAKVERKGGENKEAVAAAEDAEKKIDAALEFLGNTDKGNTEEKTQGGGGLRRKTRRRRHHKTKRKLKRFRKTRIKKKHRKKRTRKH